MPVLQSELRLFYTEAAAAETLQPLGRRPPQDKLHLMYELGSPAYDWKLELCWAGCRDKRSRRN